jgi:hypothetical protein
LSSTLLKIINRQVYNSVLEGREGRACKMAVLLSEIGCKEVLILL